MLTVKLFLAGKTFCVRKPSKAFFESFGIFYCHRMRGRMRFGKLVLASPFLPLNLRNPSDHFYAVLDLMVYRTFVTTISGLVKRATLSNKPVLP